MNYRLSVGVSRPKGKSCYVLEAEGKEVVSKVKVMKEGNIKKEVLNVLSMGLNHCRTVVKHEDLLVIDIQNRHLHQWLSEGVDYKGYEKELDSVYNTLDTVDCRYRFVFNDKPYAKNYLEKHGKTEIKGSSISDM